MKECSIWTRPISINDKSPYPLKVTSAGLFRGEAALVGLLMVDVTKYFSIPINPPNTIIAFVAFILGVYLTHYILVRPLDSFIDTLSVGRGMLLQLFLFLLFFFVVTSQYYFLS